MDKSEGKIQEVSDNPNPSTSGNMSASKKKKVYNMEPRTPLKRQRVPVNRFQSPATEELPTSAQKTPKGNKEEVVVLQYKKGVFLAVRGDEGSFYMCRTQQNVYKTTKHFKIQWLDLNEPPNIYKFDFLDATEIECVLTNVKMERIARETYRLPHSEQTRIENILLRALKKEKGEPIEEDDMLVEESGGEEDFAEDDSEEEDWEDDEPSAKKPKYSKSDKPKATPKSRKSITVALKGSGSKKSNTKSKGKKIEKEKVKKQKKEKKPEKERKRGPDRKLKPNPKVRIVEKDPLFQTKDHVPFISKNAHAKLVFRAIFQNDIALLKQLLEDSQHIYSVGAAKSLTDSWTSLHYALKNNNVEAVKLLAKDILADADADNVRRKLPKPRQLISTISTGTYNPRYLGVQSVRKLTVGRGSKEGNQAFTKEKDEYNLTEDIITDALQMGVNKETLDVMIANSGDNYNYNDEKLEKIVFAVLRGHRSLAGKLMEDALNRGGFGFNFLHKDVLVFNNEDLKQFQSASVRKKPLNNASMTPLHCACINPNIKYLEKLLSVEPDINLEDKGGRRPIHYAASCESTAPLELLIKKGANPNEVTRRRFTPLHYACYAERPKNIDLLLKTAAAKTAAEGDGGDPMMAKWGIGGINRPNWETVCPIHIAVQSGNAEVVKALLKHGVDVNKPLSASKEKVSPLMIAAGKGYLDIARLLIQAGAVVEQVDKFKRTALTHAVMNGSVTVTSYLLYLGADPNRVDSSNNSLVHYAAAYGWYFVLKMLVNEGGADPKKANDWKLTPVGIAFMKAHMGLVDFLLKMPGVDINFKNDSGMTLISIACGSVLNSGLYEQIVYLMDKGSDPSITDINGMNALHHLAGNTVKPSHTGVQHYQKSYDENMDLSVKIAELLMKAGCNPAVKTLKKQTAVTLAIEKVNTKLVRVLVEKGGVISAEKDEDGANALHHLAQQCMGNDLAPLLKILAQENPLNNIKENGLDEKMEVDSNDNGDVVKMDKEPEIPKLKRVTSFRSGLEGIKQMVTEVDHSGYTPFLLACCTYANFKKPHVMKDSEVPKVYQNGCDFIRTLIELTGLDVSMTVQKKYQVNDVVKKKATDEKKEYNEFGKQSAVHFMINRGKKSSDGADYQGLRMVLEKKPDLELKNLDGKSALAVAVEKQDKQAVKILLEAGANPNTSFLLDKETTVTALTTAAKLGNPDLVQMLVRAKAQVDCRNSKTKQTPLHLAVANRGKESNAVDMAVALLEGGADINSLDNDKCTPLHLVVSANSGTSNASTDLEELLISRGANVYAKDIENRMPLHYAFLKQGRPSPCTALDPIELCSVLTKAMKDQQIDEMDKYCLTPLHLAANRGATICCVHLLQRKAEVNRHDQDGNTPLSLAVNKGHDSCAIMLIQKGANVADKVNIVPPEKKEEEKDKKPSWKWKPERVVEKDETETYSIFQEAIMNELQGVAHMVLDNTTLDSKVIEAALRVNRYHVALRLLKRINTLSSLQITNASRQNLLHVLALDTEPRSQADLQLKVAKMLVEKGVSVSAIDDYGCTPLHYACLKHQAFGLGEFLMEQDKTLDLSKKDKFGRSVLGAFFWNQRVISESVEESTKWLKMFLSKGGNFNILYDYPTSDVPTFDVVQNVVPDYFTTASERRISPIIFSIHFADFGMVKFLLDHGVSPNFPDSEGVTPLMHAVRSNDLSLVKLLLNYSFDSDDTTTKKLALVKKASREVFTIKTFNSLTSVPEEDDIEEEEEEDGDNEEKEESEEEEEDAGDEGDQEDEDDNNDQEDDDNDHDTDIVDWDEDGEDDAPEQFPTLTRMGSKQVSLTRQGSSVNKEEFPTIEKTSPVDLNATDRQGWTVIHHLVCPLDYGTYDAEEILYVLWKAGADVLKKDNAGLSPLQHSLIHCASKLSKRLQMIAGVEESKMEKPTLATQDVRDSLLSGETTVNYQTDAEEMLKTLDSHSSQSMKVSKVKGDDSDDDFDSDEEEDIIAKPDPNCQMKDIGELAMDDSQGIPYDVLLSKVDVSCGAWGMFNFYKMQIVWQKGVDVYVLFTRWGRIGDRGQFQHTPFQKKAEAVAEFGKVFRSKTGNYWSNVNSFEKQPKKYRLVPRDDKRQKEHKIEFSLKSDIPSKLPESVQHLFQEMTSVSMMLAAVNKTGIYSDAMPFGKIKREALIEGRKSLNQIGDLIKAIENQQKSGMMTAEDTQSYQSNCEKISKVTNEYYHLIPHYGFTFEKITPINTYGLLKKHMKVLSDLLDLECASKMLLGAQSKLSQMNPLDYIHQAVGCKIEPMTEDSPESQYILKYLYSSCETEVQAIYKLSRPGEEERLSGKNLDNHKLLFHGSSTANFLSILHRGLLVSPPEVPFTGNLFGEGVYFADTFCKSKDYCYNTNPESTTNLCLVCEVALGKVQECPMYVGTPTQDLRDTDFNSKCILGRQGPNPAFNIALPYGPTIPLGMQHDAHPSVGRYMSFSEYVIQDPSQICLRYLIEFTKANQRSGT